MLRQFYLVLVFLHQNRTLNPINRLNFDQIWPEMCTILNLGPNQEKPNFSPNTETPMNNYNPFIGKRNQKVKMPITKVSLPVEIHKSWHLPESRNFCFLRQCFFSYSLKYNNASRKADSKNFLTHFIISMPKNYSSAEKKTSLFSKRQSTIKTESPGNNDLGAKKFPSSSSCRSAHYK